MNIDIQQKHVYYWLLLGTFLIAIMISIGGYTRLTKSGLSITDWKPVTGILPPLSEQEWIEEYSNYKNTPQAIEFEKRIEPDLRIYEFKKIFWPEWFHRIFARILGFYLIIPFVFFSFKGLINHQLRSKIAIIFSLGLLQAIIGWYMVKSGLVDVPYVSHYRLATHLLLAFVLIGYSFWTSLGIKYGQKNIFLMPGYIKAIIMIILIQICLGAFTAGTNAGKFYNSFPMMDGSFTPPEGLKNELNFFRYDNVGNIQFSHRLFAWIILLVSFGVYRRSDNFIKDKSALLFCGSVIIQFILGVLTVLYFNSWDRVALGIVHQLGATMLFISVISMAYFKTSN